MLEALFLHLPFLFFARMGYTENSQPLSGASAEQKGAHPTMKDSRLLAEQRRRKILDLIEQKGQITVRELVERFAVSAVTARGDLDALCSEDMALRSHGGAIRKLPADSDVASDSAEPRRYAEVARLAKVSVSTVVHVANGNVRVAPSVRSAVAAAARK